MLLFLLKIILILISMFVNKIAPAQRQDLLLHEAAIRNDLSTARKLIGSVDINSKSQVTKDPF